MGSLLTDGCWWGGMIRCQPYFSTKSANVATRECWKISFEHSEVRMLSNRQMFEGTTKFAKMQILSEKSFIVMRL